ncbi:growth hormone secretagogue receptor type 1-like [Asterias amurensis]|uniref:growth hormone secretagogue receptor type 1-like n=1 Tax=Asterias amurensis TaxID=7602 RepID=UPI003AB8E138
MEASNETEICSGGDFVIDFTDDAAASFWTRSENEILLVYIGVPLVVAIGVPGNLAFLFTLFRVKEMQTITNFYLANLAVSDLLYISLFAGYNTGAYFIAPDVANTFVVTSWLGCAVVTFSLDVLYFGSNLMVTLVAIERFYAICHPLKSRQSRSSGRALLLVTIFWAVAIGCSFAVVSRMSRYRTGCVMWPEDDGNSGTRPSTVNFCLPGEPWVTLCTQILYVGFWTIGMLVNSYMYYRIVRRLGLHTFATSADGGNQQAEKKKKVRRQVAKMLIISSIVYFLLQSPRVIILNVLGLIKAASGITIVQQGQVTILWPITVFLSLVNSAVNPIIYNTTNARYRAAILQAFGCSTCRGVDRQPSTTAATVSSRVAEQSESNPANPDQPNVE